MTALLLCAIVLCPAAAVAAVLVMTKDRVQNNRAISNEFSRQIDAAVGRNAAPHSDQRNVEHFN